MDFEVLGSISDLDTKQKLYGSGFLKQDRSVTGSEDDWRSLKVGKSDDFSASKETMRSPLMRSDNSLSLLSDGQQFLSFSSPNSQTLPYHHNPSRSTASAYGYGGLNGVLTGERGVFTPSQWMELEHQALIYKYITSNVPIPSNLLIPIRKAFDSVRFFSFSGGALRPNTLGWGGFHLGYAHNTDPEPGRCRRTDGKKWRCSKDAVASQKYCERHLNRGRNRSRKPVEGQNGHSVTGTTSNTTNAKLIPVGPGGGCTSNGVGFSHQLESMETGAPNPCASAYINRTFLNKENLGERTQESTGRHSMLSPTIGLKENQFSVPKQQNPYQESSQTQFGLVSSDSLLNPLHKSSSITNCKIYGSSQDLDNEGNESRNSLHQFMDDQWPKNQSEIDLQSDRTKTQLSISIPMTSNSAPANENPALSPLRLSRETNTRKANWAVPTSWESSVGGPLGEVLHSNNSNASEFKNSSGLNLMTKGWESSPCLASSPNGVLQKMIFGSLSNSSAVCSPRAEQLL